MSQVYSLFDDVCLLSEGRIVFFGTREEVGSAAVIHACAGQHSDDNRAAAVGCDEMQAKLRWLYAASLFERVIRTPGALCQQLHLIFLRTL